MPIHFMHKSVNFDELIALYAVSDVCVVSSTRDGMNLVSYEYIATQEKRHGVLVLSEFTGAAQSLNGSILVNPWNTEELAGAMQEAVTMSDEQRAMNFSKLDKYVRKYTRYVAQSCMRYFHSFTYQNLLSSSAFWGQSFVAELTRISAHGEKKLKLRRASLMKAQSQPQPKVLADGPHQGSDVNAEATNDLSEGRNPDAHVTNSDATNAPSEGRSPEAHVDVTNNIDGTS